MTVFTTLLKRAYLLLLLAPGLTMAQQEEKTTARIPIRIEVDRTSDGNIFGFNQDIIVDGVIDGDLGGINCNIHIKGEVKGNISLLGGSVRIYRDAQITGNLVCVKGRVDIHEAAEMTGKKINFFNPDKESKIPWLNTVKSQSSAFLGQTLFFFLLVIGTFYIFPNQIHEASFQLSQDQVRPAIIGVVTLAIFFFCIFFSFLLMVVGIGFLLFMVFFGGLTVVATYGMVVIFYRLGQFLESLTRSVLSVVTGILIAIVVMGLLTSLPYVNTLIYLGFLIFGTGIVIETRFGTNKQWFTKKPRFY